MADEPLKKEELPLAASAPTKSRLFRTNKELMNDAALTKVIEPAAVVVAMVLEDG